MVIIDSIAGIQYRLLGAIENLRTEMKSGIRGLGEEMKSDARLDRKLRIPMARVLTMTSLCLMVFVKRFPLLPA